MWKYIWVGMSLVVLISRPVRSADLEHGKTLSTFDPFEDIGDADRDEEALREADLQRPRTHHWTVNAGYKFTYRKDLPTFKLSQWNDPALNINYSERATLDVETEQQHLWSLGATYRPFPFFFAGVHVPVMKTNYTSHAVYFDGTPQRWDEVDEIGLGDLATYIGSSLPLSWFPLTLTAMLMWPTGDIDKGMGTGEFSGGLFASASWIFGKFAPGLSGYYFFVKDPEDGTGRELPNVYAISGTFGVQVLPWMKPSLGFEWAYTTLVTNASAHVSKPSIKVSWKLLDWLHLDTGFAMEVHPTKALIPSLTAMGSL